ncbi:uncharacterized protein LOC117608681 [Osmia lignaria lignaria]|uniref:uncharacterized protein LOC117608681 n=1 Tax=Osmia lignaria lignaria TaxID=1437193 RepID=UPI0014784D9D|nr:UPF0449 protein C19orf25-like [Osmia lignaria]
MFSNKKNNLPPRPHIPNSEHVLEDLNNAAMDDVAFKIINKDEITEESQMNANISDTYHKMKMYLNMKQRLKHLENMLKSKEEQLQTDNNEIRRLADDIRKQAQAALVT